MIILNLIKRKQSYINSYHY